MTSEPLEHPKLYKYVKLYKLPKHLRKDSHFKLPFRLRRRPGMLPNNSWSEELCKLRGFNLPLLSNAVVF
jgi:hypothetical protein